MGEIYFLIVALMLAFGLMSTAGSVLGTDTPVVTVVSCSMYPQYNTGDIVFVEGEDYEDIQKGDVLVFSADNMKIPVIHRVVEKDDGTLGTRGDNTGGQNENLGEGNISMDRVRGVAKASIPRVGLIKLGLFDFLGLNSFDRPFAFDSYTYNCPVKVPPSERTWLK